MNSMTPSNQLDIIDIYQPLHQKSVEYIYFSNLQCTDTKIDHILGQQNHTFFFFKTRNYSMPPVMRSQDHNGVKLKKKKSVIEI